jgi:hypothetical protein
MFARLEMGLSAVASRMFPHPAREFPPSPDHRSFTMPIDLAALATAAVTTFLVPYARDQAKEFAGALSEKVSEAAADHVVEWAPKLWQRVRQAFTADDDLITLGLMDEFEKDPDTYKAPIEKKLKEKLAADPTLAEEVNRMVNRPGADGQSLGAQILHAVNAGIVDLRGANFAGAQGVTITGLTINQPRMDD